MISKHSNHLLENLAYVADFQSMGRKAFSKKYGYGKDPVRRKSGQGVWMKSIRQAGVGKHCPTCYVRMRPSYLQLPNSVTVEHVIPLCMGGKNIKNGVKPNCVPMCDACNKARNDVMMKFGKKLSVVKFLWEQVWEDDAPLHPTYEAFFNRQLRYHQRAEYKKNPGTGSGVKA